MEVVPIIEWIRSIRRQIRIFKWNKLETTIISNLNRELVGDLQLFQRSLSDRIQIAEKQILNNYCKFSQLNLWEERFYIDFHFNFIGVDNEILEITSRVYYIDIEDDLSDRDSEMEFDPRYDDDLSSHASDEGLFYVPHNNSFQSFSLNDDD